MSLVVLVFLHGSLIIDVLFLALVIVLAVRTSVPFPRRAFLPICLFLLLTFISNVLFSTGRVLYEIGTLTVTEEGLRGGAHLTMRLLILIIGARVLTATTTAEELVQAVVKILGPLGRRKPVRDFILTLSLALRFLPIIYNEAGYLYRDTLRNNQGLTLPEKIRLSASLITPLFERSLEKARNLSKGERVDAIK
jgi:energy-coupling factor transport system permease protein